MQTQTRTVTLDPHATPSGAITAPGARRATPEWLPRFTYTERFLHWINSFAFLILAATGLGLYLRPLEDAANHLLARLPGLLGRLSLTDVHVTTAMLFILNPLVWFAFGNRRALMADARALLHFDRDDRRWLARVVTCRRPLPPQGQYNAGQKLSAIGLVGAWLAFLVTGLMQLPWPLYARLTGAAGGAGGEGGAPGAGGPPGGLAGAGGPPMGGRVTGPFGIFHFSMSALNTVNTVHALIALVCVIWLAGHIYFSTLNRGTRHSLWGMVTGRVQRDWALAHHAKWVETVEAVETRDAQTGGDAR